MAITRKHGIYGVGLGAVLLGGITRQNLATNSEVKGEASSGELYNRFIALYAQRLAPGFTTRSIATALGATGVMGLSLSSAALTLYAQKHAAGATRASGGNHRSYTFASGILAPRQLTVDHRGDATLTYEAVVVSADGTNSPITITDSVSLPSGLTDAERFTLGTWTVGGISLGEIRRLQIDFGVDIASEGADSEIWDTFCSVRGQHSTITFSGIDVEWVKSTNIPTAGLAATHANTVGYLRKRALGSTFVANGTAQHIRFTAAGLITPDNIFEGSERDAGEVSLKMALYYDGSNAPLTVNTASAIT